MTPLIKILTYQVLGFGLLVGYQYFELSLPSTEAMIFTGGLALVMAIAELSFYQYEE